MTNTAIIEKTKNNSTIDNLGTQINKEIKFTFFIKDKNVIAQLEQQGMQSMREVQYRAYNKVLEGHNVIMQSNTGSGKTLAYLLPLIMSERRGLIIVPTYELATQTYHVAKTFTSRVGINAGKLCVDLHADILISTLGKCREMQMADRVFCCIDEADRILENDMFLNGYFKQFILVSATIDEVKILRRLVRRCGRWMKISTQTKNIHDQIRIVDCGLDNECKETGNDERMVFYRVSITNEQRIREFYMEIEYDHKLFIFVELLKRNRSKKVIVFFNTINSVVFFYNLLKRMNFNVIAIFGKINQQKRKAIVEKYETIGGVLLCTDLMSRGFDFKSIDLVVHFEPSFNLDDYIHRKGRTGRNKSGKSIILLSNLEIKLIDGMNRIRELVYIEKKFLEHNKSTHGMSVGNVPLSKNVYSGSLVPKIQKMVKNDFFLHKMAIDALKSFLRIYEGNTGETFNVDSLNLNDIARTFGLKEIPILDFV